jgi:hypothetical protein
MKNIFTSFLMIFTFSLYLSSCGKAEDIISPTHYSRVPRPVNVSISYDTTTTGKYRVMISWQVESTTNLKDFEIYRSINKSNFFFLIGGITTTKYIDSSNAGTVDSLNLAYFVNGRGIDRFIGQSSDTIKILVTKPS